MAGMDAELWTLAQLPDQVAALLAGNYTGQSSGRVGELPTARTIRWYTTIGLVDRPVAASGRAVLYGPRHALQLAAIKKLQAEGRSLAEIQERLVGASNRQLTAVVGRPSAKPVPLAAGPADALDTVGVLDTSDALGTAAAGAFWRRGADGRTPVEEGTTAGTAGPNGSPAATAARPLKSATDSADDTVITHANTVNITTSVAPAVRLADSVTVVLSAATRMPDAEELAAIERAAAPLLDLLGRLGLAETTKGECP
ncbi:MerR family transcriptional regulator [Frankia sp. CNm7]|uniref:MerR family transcriptional regulator n=1 Tax=Frankia nepalensis TaxID=1836974 RepID=A0A937R6J2_9ACTN|nr:helix-turn-helix domain-containing protein [Frankia nepalensis]MBL7496798.1 MerR family transcriptional regulator [Frankia nepalensis]MBL7511549.1 MerR family transcriptional regulator [Frankia nepalensis]MBL7521354.1 MerR family transcriptional regulator [Frankia nepalensis]MBL7626643.1 MerR family transcriptional regulator [Frankia nepalensis]